jgi:hypothetical protein
MLKDMQKMFSILNTHLDQLANSRGHDQVEDLYNRNKSRCPNGQTSLNQFTGSQNCNQNEDLQNLNESRHLDGQTSQTPSSSSNKFTLKLSKL